MTPGVTGLKMTKPAAYNRTGSVGWTSDAENNSTAQDPGGEDKELRMQGFAQFQIPSSNSKTNKVQIPKRTPAASKHSLSSDASKSGVMGGLSPMRFFPTHHRGISSSISDSASTRLGRPQVPVHANTSKVRCTASSSTSSIEGV